MAVRKRTHKRRLAGGRPPTSTQTDRDSSRRREARVDNAHPGPTQSSRQARRLTWMDALLLIGAVISVAVVAAVVIRNRRQAGRAHEPPPVQYVGRQAGMVLLPEGRFMMGHDTGAAPRHEVQLDRFWIDEHEVTNAQFTRFVDQTQYITTAEREGWGWVWPRQPLGTSAGSGRPSLRAVAERVDGANWRHPAGPQSTITGRDAHPVVQISWRDAQSYAAWSGKRLPSEAQWERAARGGLVGEDHPWPSATDARLMANFSPPLSSSGDADDGFRGPAPIGSFPTNRFGLHDLAGNVREWCADWYAEAAYQRHAPRAPTGPAAGKLRVVRGGSWQSPAAAITTWRREALPADYRDNATGFRCVAGPSANP